MYNPTIKFDPRQKDLGSNNITKIILYHFLFSLRNALASLRKLAAISTITAPIGNAAMILTDSRLLIELSLWKNAIRNKLIRYIPKASFCQYIDVPLT